MGDIVRFRKKDATMWKIDGDAFEDIKTLSEAFDKLKKESEENLNKIHDGMWQRVYQEIGKKEKESLVIDNSYKELGFCIVKKTDNGVGSLIDLLKR